MMEDPQERKRRRRADPQIRKQVGDSARRQLEQAVNDGQELEDKLIEAATTMGGERMGLPLAFRDSAGRQTGGGTLIKKPTAQDMENYTEAPTHTCGTCRNFNLKGGQKMMVEQRFTERLVLEQEWALKHLGAPLDHAGVCDASGGELVTMTISDASGCAGYRPRSRLFR